LIRSNAEQRLKELNVPPLKQAEFIQYMNNKFGAKFTAHQAFQDIITRALPPDSLHVMTCAEHIKLDEILIARIYEFSAMRGLERYGVHGSPTALTVDVGPTPKEVVLSIETNLYIYILSLESYY
jgi:hypothetical protein